MVCIPDTPCPKPQTRNPKPGTRFPLLAILFPVLLVGCHQPDFTGVRAVLAQARAEVQASSEAASQQNSAGAQQHMAKAQELFVKVRKQFDQDNAARARDPEVLRDYAATLTVMGDTDLAAEALERATKFQTDNPALWLDLGRALMTMGPRRAEQATQALRRALELDATSASAAECRASLGRVFSKQGLYDLARREYEEALKLNADHTGAKVGLATLGLRDGKVRECSDTFDALGMLPPQSMVQSSLELEEGLKGFDQTRACFADTPENHLAYAKLLVRVGRLQEGLTAAERSVTLDPAPYATWNLVGDLSLQAGNKSRAKEAYQRSLAIKPDQPRTQEALTSLDQPPPPANQSVPK
jgi:tetratricopeptide (TPR) repeat protein